MKDHEIAQLVNELRDIAIDFHATQQLRERIADVVLSPLKRLQKLEEGVEQMRTNLWQATDKEARLLARIKQLAQENSDLREIVDDMEDIRQEYSHQLKEARDELVAQEEAQMMNAPWLTQAHTLCTDCGIPQGHINDRIAHLRQVVGEMQHRLKGLEK